MIFPFKNRLFGYTNHPGTPNNHTLINRNLFSQTRRGQPGGHKPHLPAILRQTGLGMGVWSSLHGQTGVSHVLCAQ